VALHLTSLWRATEDSPLIGLPNVIGTPHIAGSTQEAQEEVGTQVAVQIRDYLAEGIIRNAVNLPALSADQYRRVRPYLELAERLGSLVSQASQTRPGRIRIRYAGEVAEVGTHLLRSAVLAGVLNAVLDEKVNVVNAPAVAAARGLTVEEERAAANLVFPIRWRFLPCRKKLATPVLPRKERSCTTARPASSPLTASPSKRSWPVRSSIFATRMNRA